MGRGSLAWEDHGVADGPNLVVVVDDQAPFRAAARAVLRRLAGFELAGEAASGAEAIDMVDQVRPALVLMDINMPQMNGIEATREIVAAHPDSCAPPTTRAICRPTPRPAERGPT